MVRWVLTEFRVEKTDRNILNFKTKIVIPETHRDYTFIYKNQKILVNGSELKLGYSIYEIERRLESLLEASLIKELSRHSRIEEYLRVFALTKITAYPEGTIANLHYAYNNKFLNLGKVLVSHPHIVREKLCKVPLEVETNAVSSIKSFHELLTDICRSVVMISIELNKVNEILNILLQKIGI
jgi:hypothetical protein